VQFGVREELEDFEVALMNPVPVNRCGIQGGFLYRDQVPYQFHCVSAIDALFKCSVHGVFSKIEDGVDLEGFDLSLKMFEVGKACVSVECFQEGGVGAVHIPKGDFVLKRFLHACGFSFSVNHDGFQGASRDDANSMKVLQVLQVSSFFF